MAGLKTLKYNLNRLKDFTISRNPVGDPYFKNTGFTTKKVKKNYVCCMCNKRVPLKEEIQIIAKLKSINQRHGKNFDKITDFQIGRVCTDKCFKAFLLVYPKLLEEA